jgi:hypothetical protein
VFTVLKKDQNMAQKIITLSILMGLAACGGGGGGGSPVITTTSINNATFNSTSTNNFGYNGVTAISALTNTPTSTTNTSTLTYSGSNITKAVVVGPDGALITFDTNLGDTIATTQAYGGVLLVGAIKQNQQEQILIANFPSSTKSKIVNHNKIVGSKMYHSVSLQANTSSVDPTVSANYSGKLLGTYSSLPGARNENGQVIITSADVSMTANFTTDSIAFSTNNTVGKWLPSLGSNTSLSYLNMTGTLTDPDNNNSFTGNVTTSGAHTGSVTALVIGDSAEELSGFGSTSATNEIHSFGFITKK